MSPNYVLVLLVANPDKGVDGVLTMIFLFGLVTTFPYLFSEVCQIETKQNKILITILSHRCSPVFGHGARYVLGPLRLGSTRGAKVPSQRLVFNVRQGSENLLNPRRAGTSRAPPDVCKKAAVGVICETYEGRTLIGPSDVVSAFGSRVGFPFGGGGSIWIVGSQRRAAGCVGGLVSFLRLHCAVELVLTQESDCTGRMALDRVGGAVRAGADRGSPFATGRVRQRGFADGVCHCDGERARH